MILQHLFYRDIQLLRRIEKSQVIAIQAEQWEGQI